MRNSGRSFSRPAFLGLAGGLGLRLAVGRSTVTESEQASSGAPQSLDELLFIQPRPARLDLWGRITEYGTPVRETPGLGMPVVRFLERNVVLPLLEEVHAPGSNPNNRPLAKIAYWASSML